MAPKLTDVLKASTLFKVFLMFWDHLSQGISSFTQVSSK